MRAARSAARRTSCSAIPTWCTRASCRTIRAGRSCSRTCGSSSSTSCTRIAACSAAISANILRRLQRVCRHYGSDPIFICSSATIANPRELAEGLTGRPFELVEKSGAPRGEKFFLFVNPPVVNAQLGIRRSYLAETRRVALEFLKHNLQLILFAQSRLAVEILTTYLKDAFHGPPGAADVIRGYRGGYLPNRRREIERGLREGQVRAVVSTNALELGIDIGALDVVGHGRAIPGTIAATWQRAGRAGRRTTRSAAVLVASSAPIDQFIVRNPSYFFDASPEHALINPDNLHILLDHVKCAAFELPFTDDERFGARQSRRAGGPVGARRGRLRAPRRRPVELDATSRIRPTRSACARSRPTTSSSSTPRSGERVIGETDFTSGPATLHEKAIYIVEGQLFQVERFDFDGRKAYRARGRLRLLHGRDHLHEGHDSGHVRVGVRIATGRSAESSDRLAPIRPAIRIPDRSRRLQLARRGPRRLARRRLQEDQVLHERERRLGRAGSARAADAHLVVLADDSRRR